MEAPKINFPDGIPIGEVYPYGNRLVRPSQDNPETDYSHENYNPQKFSVISKDGERQVVFVDLNGNEAGYVRLTEDGYIDSVSGECVSNLGTAMVPVIYEYHDIMASKDASFIALCMELSDQYTTQLWNSKYGWIKLAIDNANGYAGY